jgi:hypothetical protein
VRDLDHLARLHPAEPAVDRQLLADIAVAQELHEGRALDLALEGGVPAQGGQFRAEQEGPVRPRALPAEIERLFPDPVADQGQHTLLTVPDGDGEHAHGAGDRRLDAPGVEARDQGLGVGMSAPGGRFAALFQLRPQVEMVVDLAVVADHVAPRGRRHRLMPGGAEIDDGEPQMAEGDAGLAGSLQVPVGIRAAPADGIRHAGGQGLQARFGRAWLGWVRNPVMPHISLP